MRGVLGVSGGIPGTPGLHGSPASGVVFALDGMLGEVSLWFDGNGLLGQTMAHEIGHYLGLFHTTEMQQGMTDRLADTPECPQSIMSDPYRMSECPDYGNLMFPTASMRDSVEVTPLQKGILRGQPNVQP